MGEITVGNEKRRPAPAGRVTKAIIFLVILALLFHFLTLVYDRPVSKNVLDYQSRPENTIDVVTIGSSNVYRYFIPSEGWLKYGITSFAYALAAAEGENTIWMVKDVLKTQKPKLLILEVRGFLGTRNRKALSPSTYRLIKNYANPLDRWKIIRHYCRINGISFSPDQVPYYLTLLLNHENYWTLMRPENWKKAVRGTKFTREPGEGPFLGYVPAGNVQAQKQTAYDETYIEDLSAENEASLREILDYCRKIGQDVMLVSSPFIYTKQEIGELNAVALLAKEYGIPFLNTNTSGNTEKMGIDFGYDFYNSHHTNICGAIKYSNLVFDYLHENYELDDHRGDPDYAYFDEETKAYQKKRIVLLAQAAVRKVSDKKADSGAAASEMAAEKESERESETEM